MFLLYVWFLGFANPVVEGSFKTEHECSVAARSTYWSQTIVRVACKEKKNDPSGD